MIAHRISQYRRSSHYNTTHRRRQNLYALPRQQSELLISPPFNLLDTLTTIDDAIDHNADIADAILELGLQVFSLPADPPEDSPVYWHNAAKPGDMSKAHSTIRQFYRDWSVEGFRAETRPLLDLTLEDLEMYLKKPSLSDQPTILLPGAGLGRLLFELSLAGYQVEGNEISWHQLLASNFVLNAVKAAEQYKLYPFASTFTNHLNRHNQLVEARIPDIHPGSAVESRMRDAAQGKAVMGSMNMAAGDFLTSYAEQDDHQKFDAVVTVYFIDTAPNLFRYIETIKRCLKEGGVWINIGPLLWHFDGKRTGSDNGDSKVADQTDSEDRDTKDTGIGEPGSFELTDEEVRVLVESMGFEIINQEQLPEEYGGYIQDPRSMIQNRYRCSQWVARRLTLEDAQDVEEMNGSI